MNDLFNLWMLYMLWRISRGCWDSSGMEGDQAVN